MKTVIISIPTGIIARNILRTGVFSILKRRKDVRWVVVLPPNVDEHLKQELAGENVVIEERKAKVRAGAFRHFILYPFMRYLVYTSTTRYFLRYGSKLSDAKNTPIKAFFGRPFFNLMSRFVWFKRFCRWFDYKFFGHYDRPYQYLFDKYQPSLVSVNNFLHDPIELALIRLARRNKVPSVGMVKSWDNIDKLLLLALPDSLMVWNEKMKKDLIKLQDVKPQGIIMTGIPQFDIYKKPEILLTREEYCRRVGLDPSKKILFFGAEWLFIYDDEIVDILYQFISQGAFNQQCNLLVRPHFEELLLKTGRFERFKQGHPGIVLDRPDRAGKCFHGWDPSWQDMKHLANHLYHCDIMITSFSTLSIDAIAFDKPVINIAFDGLHPRSKQFSFMRIYDYAHYRPVVQSGAVKMVGSQEELRRAIDLYLANPGLDSEKREQLRQKFFYKLDGKSAERIAQVILGKV